MNRIYSILGIFILIFVIVISSQKNVTEVQAIQACTEVPRDYPQCGGVCNGVTYSGNHTVMVHKRVDSSCNVSWQCEDLGVRMGECDNNPAPAPVPVPAPAPVPPPPAQEETVQTCKGTKTINQLRHELELAGYPGPWDTNSMIAAYNRAACPVNPPSPPPPPPPPIQNCTDQLQVVNGTVVCVAQNQQQSQNQTVTQTNTQTVNVTQGAAAAEPRVVFAVNRQPVATVAGVQAKELPKTGLPLLAWGALGLIPAGFKIRSFCKGIIGEYEDKSNYLWEERQFKSRA